MDDHGQRRDWATEGHVSALDSGTAPTLDDIVARRVQRHEPVCLYAYDLDALHEHVTAVVATLPERCRMFYAMKANSAQPLLRALATLVDGFEVASGGELSKARAVSGDIPVLFGGPAKTAQEIAQALEQGVTRLHVESLLELHRISDIAVRARRTAEVLLRVNLRGPFPAATLAMAGRATQFGIDEKQLGPTIAAALTMPGVKLVGFHMHSLSNNLSALAHLQMIDLYRRKVTAWEQRFGVRCEVLNFGGGIGIDYATPGTFFDWELFTQGLHDLLDATFPAHWREIDFECGRFLVAACGSYATEVLDIKRNHGVSYVLVRGGTHHLRLPASWQHSHPFNVLSVDRWSLNAPRPQAHGEPVTVVGQLCTPKDVLARDAVVPCVRAGDVLVFMRAGAYGWEISHHDFLSHPHPEHIFLECGGHFASE